MCELSALANGQKCNSNRNALVLATEVPYAITDNRS